MAPVVDLYREGRLRLDWDQYWFNRVFLVVVLVGLYMLLTRRRTKESWERS
jgi:hypothetical protein